MNIDAFLKGMDPQIVSRGRAYYFDGKVYDVRRSGCTYYGDVAGSAGSVYHVRVLLSERGDVLRCDCDCPYDAGRACKHTAAVLMMIRRREYRVCIPHSPDKK